jgi:hypothetical protein
MATYHYQCQYCYCTTGMWEEDDGTDDYYGGAVGDCGCHREEDEYWDEDDD